MKNKISLSGFIVALFFYTTMIHAQNPVMKVFEDWHDTAGTQNTFYKAVTRTIPGTTTILVAGATLNASGNYDMLVEKLNGSGGVVWSQQYDGAGHGDDAAFDLQVDGSGNVYITGTYYQDATDSNNAITIKYNSSGVQQWASVFNGTGSGFDATAGLYIDNSNGDVYSVGSEWEGSGNFHDILMIRYNSSGTQQWASTLDYMNGDDGAYKITASGTKIFVTGAAQSAPLTYDYALIIANKSNGSGGISFTSSGSALGISKITDIVVDDSSNVYITGGVLNGGTLYDFRTIKLDSLLNVKWSNDFDAGYNLNDLATGIALDSLRNVIVVGSSETVFNGKDYAVVKYDNNGGLQWLRFFNGAANGDDSASAIVVSPNDTDKIYITGYSYNGSTKDYYTMRYDGAGNPVWEIGFNSLQNGNDEATAIALDTLGGIIVTGQVKLADTVFNYSTVKYFEKRIVNVLDTAPDNANYLFLENRGQLINSSSIAVPQVKYYNSLASNPQIYFTDTSLSYVFERGDSIATSPDSSFRVDITYKGQNSGKIRAYDLDSTYDNFFLPQVLGGCSRVQNYHQLVFPDLYNKIDVEYGSNMSGLKTYYIIKPGGGGSPVNSIDMNFSGADSVKVISNQLKIYTKLGIITYPQPAVWQISTSTGAFSSLGWQPTYNLIATNEVKFSSIGSYTANDYLVIAMDWGYNPPLTASIYNNIWSTFLQGSNACEAGSGVTTDLSGNSYFTGTTTSYDFPSVNGLQTGLNGIQNAYCLKFSSNNVEVWGTYIGGDYDAVGDEVRLDASNNVFILGWTNSTGNTFPHQATGNQYSDATNTYGDKTAFIFEMNNTGLTKLWSTFFGGTDDDDPVTMAGHHLTIDASNNIFICGRTQSDASTEGFPVLANTVNGSAYNQLTFGGGNSDGYIAEFDDGGTQIWTTYYGGSGDEEVTSVAFSYPSGNLFFAGYTSSATAQMICSPPTTTGSFPICNSNGGFVQSVQGGSNDAFIGEFDTSDQLVWSSWFGGSGDEFEFIDLAISSIRVMLIGSTTTTTGSSTTCASPDAGTLPLCDPGLGAMYNSSNAGGTDIFIAEFYAPNNNLVWSTFYGAGGDEYPTKIIFDTQDNIYFGGTTKGAVMPTVDPGNNFYKQTTNADGSHITSDAFITKIAGTAVTWSTFYGGYFPWSAQCSSFFNGQTEIIGDISVDGTFNRLYVTGVAQSITTTGGPSHVNFPYRCGNPQYCWQEQDYNALDDEFVACFSLDGVVGTHDAQVPQMSTLQVYPNPTGDMLHVILPTEAKGGSLLLFDELGQVVVKLKVDNTPSKTVDLDLTNVAPGLYFLQNYTTQNVYSVKVVKENK